MNRDDGRADRLLNGLRELGRPQAVAMTDEQLAQSLAGTLELIRRLPHDPVRWEAAEALANLALPAVPSGLPAVVKKRQFWSRLLNVRAWRRSAISLHRASHDDRVDVAMAHFIPQSRDGQNLDVGRDLDESLRRVPVPSSPGHVDRPRSTPTPLGADMTAHDVTVSVSLWLPVGRANFYSSTARSWLERLDDDGHRFTARSSELGRPGYVPALQVSVLRRILEVLPTTFGYEPTGICEESGEDDDLTRPVAVTMTLRPKSLGSAPVAGLGQLAAAGVDEVRLRADEHGGYTFTARASFAVAEEVRRALVAHVWEVFGGNYSLDRRTGQARSSTGDNGGSAGVRAYQGLGPTAASPGKPRGILTFFQLNTLVEGLFNESLSPAVFFERNEFLRDFLARQSASSLTLLENMSEVIDLFLVSDVDTATPEGLVVVLRRFLDVTAREVLQRLKWSVESVRRSLLDESVSMLHRQSKLVQLDLGALTAEQTPELAEGANENQLRGYVMLAAAKLPLVANVYEIAVLAASHLREVADPAGQSRTGLGADVTRLETQLGHWRALLQGLTTNVRGLEGAIEHAWRERLLYEQQQVRSLQEAMAEMERSRTARSATERPGRGVYNLLMLFFAVAAVLVTIREGNFLDQSLDAGWRTTLAALWPIAVVTVVFCLVVPLWDLLRQRRRDRKGTVDSYPYEFAFRLEETADPGRVHEYLATDKAWKLRSPVLKELAITGRGGGRIERVTTDRSLVKLHSIATLRVGFNRYARFEIVNEILAQRVSGRPTYVIIQCRIFGESPRPLRPTEIFELARTVLTDVGDRLTTTDLEKRDLKGIDLNDVLGLVAPLYGHTAPPRLSPAPAQRPAGPEEASARELPMRRS